jgi:predicted 2-oxoglutarate/Fe(II)-dependent dioxygenase YbiX
MHPFLLPAFLDPATCCRVREAMDRGRRETAEVAGDTITEQANVRRATTVDIEPAHLSELEERIDAARAPLERWYGAGLGEREGTGLLRYAPGGFYRPHRDRGHVRGWPAAARRAVAVVIFLNADFEGGRLRLYLDGDKLFDVQPATGLLAAFPADLLHEVLPVTGGTRDAAVDWFYNPSHS